jgi:hypothetical protein
MAPPDMAKAEGAVSKWQWVSGMVRVLTAIAAVAPETWFRLRSLRSRREPGREETHRARKPLLD